MDRDELMNNISQLEAIVGEVKSLTNLSKNCAAQASEIATHARNYALDAETKVGELQQHMFVLEQNLQEMRNIANRME